MQDKLRAVRRAVISLAALVILWGIAAKYSDINPTLFPSPSKVCGAFKELALSGLGGSSSRATLGEHIVASLGRFAAGYSLSGVCAVLLGLFLGWFPKLFAYVNPIVQILRPIAPVAWLPFLVLIVGIGDLPAIAIIFIAGFFPILLSTVTAVRNMDPLFFKVSRNFDLNGWETLVKIVFPATFPQIAVALRQALGTCWIFLVSGEMVGAQSGLGFLIMDAKNCIRADALLATMITIGVIGFTLDLLVGAGENFIAKKWGVGVLKYVNEGGV